MRSPTARNGRRGGLIFLGCLSLSMAVVAGGVLVPASSAGATQTSSAAEPRAPYVSGLLSTSDVLPGDNAFVRDVGIYDRQGRFIFLHGVNAVYKHPPYELYVDPGKPWNFDAKDAAQIASMGFNVVRLGILWQGIEPGNVGPNNPKVCAKGPPGDPGQWNQAVADRYIQKLVSTVDLLGRYHVYSLIDMHQDVYSEVFKGEGFPAWSVCTDGIPLTKVSGRWSNNYASAPLNAAFRNFWSNDVVGNLQGEYDRSWAAVASALANNPWVAGYDPINEPFTPSVKGTGAEAVDDQLECFYTGRAHPGNGGEKDEPLECSPNVPNQGVIPTIQAADPNHMIFFEPTIYELHNKPNYVGAMPFPNLVLNFHAYCGARSPLTGNPYNNTSCFTEIERRYIHRELQVTPPNSSFFQPQGLPLFLSEFGATQDPEIVSQATSTADSLSVGWAYWAWKYYKDPTGSSAEALVSPSNVPYPQAKALEEAYPEAVAGTVLTLIYEYSSRDLYLTYVSDPNVTAPTLVYIPASERKVGYCPQVYGAKVISGRDAPVLEVKDNPHATKVVLAVTRGAC